MKDEHRIVGQRISICIKDSGELSLRKTID
jgi:hypothetical protein